MGDFDYNPDEIDAEEEGHVPVSLSGITTQIMPGNRSVWTIICDIFLDFSLQEYAPTRDNVIFLIDAHSPMFENAGLRNAEVCCI